VEDRSLCWYSVTLRHNLPLKLLGGGGGGDERREDEGEETKGEGEGRADETGEEEVERVVEGKTYKRENSNDHWTNGEEG
jgi:hypothetical protein